MRATPAAQSREFPDERSTTHVVSWNYDNNNNKTWSKNFDKRTKRPNTPRRNVTHQVAARGGPVVLRPVRATPCYTRRGQRNIGIRIVP